MTKYEYYKKWRAEHREYNNLQRRLHLLNNPELLEKERKRKREWYETHPDKVRAIHLKTKLKRKQPEYREQQREKLQWKKDHVPGFREKLNESERKTYQKIKADPERYQKYLADQRERYHKRKENDPEWYRKLQDYHRTRYQKKKGLHT